MTATVVVLLIMATAKPRSTNFTQEEANLILTEYEKNKSYLDASFSTQVTAAGKRKVWNEIAMKVNALGVAVRSGDQCKSKWKGIKMDAKKQFNLQKKYRNQTGGGPPPKRLKPSTLRTIELMKDQASFKGIEGGVDTFSVADRVADRVNPLVEFSMMSDIEESGNEGEENDLLFSPFRPDSSLRTVDTSAIRINTSPAASPPHHHQFPVTNDDPGTANHASTSAQQPAVINHSRPSGESA